MLSKLLNSRLINTKSLVERSRALRNYNQLSYSTKAYFSVNTLRIPIDLHFSENHRKRFFINHDSTLAQVEAIIKKEDKTIQSIQFKDNDKVIEDKNVAFVDNFFENNFKLQINRQIVPITSDLNDALGYLNQSRYDNILYNSEVPINDATILTNFANVFHENLEKKIPNKQVYETKQVLEIMELTLKNFKAKNQNKTAKLDETLETLILEKEQELKLHQKLEKEVYKKAGSPIKWAIRITIIQWIILFYLTYYVCGWDVTEPIGYLISLVLEIAGIYYFLRYSRDLGQQNVFIMAFRRYKSKIFAQKSTHVNCELKYLNDRINFLHQKGLYTKSF